MADDTTRDDGPKPRLSKDEEKKLLDSMTIEQKVKYHYEHAQGSIQDIARVYRLDVAEVLTIIGETDILEVQTTGDLIDPSELQPGQSVNPSTPHRVTYTSD